MSALETTRDVLAHAVRYSVKQGITQKVPKFPGAGPWRISNINGPYALNTIIAIDAAVAAGVETVDRTPFIVAMIDSLTRSHRSQPSVWPNGKPNDWARFIIRANLTAGLVEMALRYWPLLSSAIRERLIACVEYDVSRERVRYWKRPDGTFWQGKSGDSKSEEVAWTAMLAHAAVLLGLTQYTALRDEAILAAFSVPADGLLGYNVDPDFMVENHMLNRADGTRVQPGDPTGTPIKPHPAYQKSVIVAHERMACVSHLQGVPPPVGLHRRLSETWHVLTARDYRVADGWLPPGGTIYRADGFIHFPRGSDFSEAANRAGAFVFALADAVVAREHPDAAQRALALTWCEIHMQTALDQQLAQQVRMGAAWDGRMTASSALGPNQACAQLAAFTYRALTRAEGPA